MTSGEKFSAKQDSGLLRFSLGITGSTIVANCPYLGGTVLIVYAKFPTVPIFLNSLNVQHSAICPQI